MIWEKYPFHLSDREQEMTWVEYLKPIDTPSDVHEKRVKEVKAKVEAYEKLDEKSKQEYIAFVKNVRTNIYPCGYYSGDFSTSATAVKFYNRAVYEALEDGMGIEQAKRLARSATREYIPYEKPKANPEVEKMFTQGLHLEEDRRRAKIMMEKGLLPKPEESSEETSSSNLADEIMNKYSSASEFYKQKNDLLMLEGIKQQISIFQSLLLNPSLGVSRSVGDSLQDLHEREALVEKKARRGLQLASLARNVFDKYEIYGKGININA